MVKYMIYDSIKKEFFDSSDLKCKKVKGMEIIYLDSLCSSDKINEYIVINLTMKRKKLFLKDMISGPNVIYIESKNLIGDYLFNGFAIVTDGKDIIACEVKANLFRNVAIPTVESSVNGPKDSFNESILMNLGLIKRRIHSEKLINKDFNIGSITKTKVSILYMKNGKRENLVKMIEERLSKLEIETLLDIEDLRNILTNGKGPMPTILKTERPDRVAAALMEGKIAIIADNSPYALILPSFWADFINPMGDHYVKASNVNLLKIVRFLCFFITLCLPSLYIAIINYNPESVPMNLLLSFQASRSSVPFPSAVEAIFMIFICMILRESDIRFPSSYGSSISILGALILGESAVSAHIASPIMIIIIGITFITGLIFSSGEMISGLRIFRFFLLLLTIFWGLYGFVIGILFLSLYMVSLKSGEENYMYPIAPFNKRYLFKSLLKGKEKKDEN